MNQSELLSFKASGALRICRLSRHGRKALRYIWALSYQTKLNFTNDVWDENIFIGILRRNKYVIKFKVAIKLMSLLIGKQCLVLLTDCPNPTLPSGSFADPLFDLELRLHLEALCGFQEVTESPFAT